MDTGLSPENLKQFDSAMVGALKALDSELIAYQMALVTMKETQPADAETFENLIRFAKTLPSYQKEIRETYDEPLERFLGKISYGQTVIEAVEEWLGARQKRIQ
jgi:hypothetical protein